MIKNLQLSTLLGVALLGVSLTAQSQTVFKEDFQEGIPETFKIINNDGNTPAAAVEFVSDAWVSFEDPLDETNLVAISTSWYSPAGQSDDWIITPEITLGSNNALTFRTRALDGNFNDGFTVYVSLTGDSIADFTALPTLLVVDGENNTWTDHTVNLAEAGYADTTIRLAFVNNSADMYLLTLDDIEVANVINHNLSLSAVQNPTEYAATPLNHIRPYSFAAIVTNLGADTLNDVKVDVKVLKDSAEVYALSKTLPGVLLSGDELLVQFEETFNPDGLGEYTVIYTTSTLEEDEKPKDNAKQITVEVNETYFARDNGQVVNSLGIGPGTTGILGQTYTLEENDVLNSVSFYLLEPTPYEPVTVQLYDMLDGKPNEVIASSEIFYIEEEGAQLLTLEFENGPVGLTAGTYYIGITEDDANLTLAYTTDIFTLGTTFLDFVGSPVDGWANNETFGFNVSYVIRPNFEVGCFLSADVSATDATCANCEDGTATVVAQSGVEPYTYAWSNNGTSATIEGLAAGEYEVTVTDDEGCTYTDTATVNAPVNTGVELGDNFQSFTAYPNPANEVLNLEFSTGSTETAEIVITNSVGQVMTVNQTISSLNHNISMDVSDLASGVYFLTVTTPTSSKKERVMIK